MKSLELVHIALGAKETFGKFAGFRNAGLSLKYPFPFQTASRPFSLQTRQFSDSVQVKSVDNVFVKIPVAVQFKVIPAQESIRDAARQGGRVVFVSGERGAPSAVHGLYAGLPAGGEPLKGGVPKVSHAGAGVSRKDETCTLDRDGDGVVDI